MLALLRERFVPVAVDQHVHRRLKDAEGRLFARVLAQANRGLEGRSQGVFLFDAEEKLLAFRNTTEASSVKRLLEKALTVAAEAGAAPRGAAEKEGVTEPGATGSERGPEPEPPAGGLVVLVTATVLGGYEDASDRRLRRYAESIGRDHLWVRRDEKEALVRGELPASLRARIVRYHLVDNTRGEPPFWRVSEVRTAEWTLANGVVEGSVHLETASGERGFRAAARGYIEADAEKREVTRFDLVVSGEFWGEGRFTRGAPPGKFPFAVTLRLIEPSCVADRTPPGGARGNLERYLE